MAIALSLSSRKSFLECRRLVKMQNRVLVYLQCERENSIRRRAQFTESIVDAFNKDKDKNVHQTKVCVKLDENKLILFDASEQPDSCADSQMLSLARSPLCPILSLTPTVIDLLPSETLERGVNAACGIILESCDGFVLMIRRASHLRTFPGVWVPPGGHIEENETLLETGLREFAEETGLVINPSDCLDSNLRILGLWESTYPPLLTLGLPIRRHIVVYYYAKLKEPFSADRLESELKLDPEEIGASMWLDRRTAQAITAGYKDKQEDNSVSDAKEIPKEIRITVTDRDGHHSNAMMDTKLLLNPPPLTGSDIERVSTGTKFALALWLKTTTNLHA